MLLGNGNYDVADVHQDSFRNRHVQMPLQEH